MTPPTKFELLKLLAKLIVLVIYWHLVNFKSWLFIHVVKIKNWLLSYLSKMFRAV